MWRQDKFVDLWDNTFTIDDWKAFTSYFPILWLKNIFFCPFARTTQMIMVNLDQVTSERKSPLALFCVLFVQWSEFHLVRFSCHFSCYFCCCKIANISFTILLYLCFILSILRRLDYSAAVQELFSFLGIGTEQQWQALTSMIIV